MKLFDPQPQDLSNPVLIMITKCNQNYFHFS